MGTDPVADWPRPVVHWEIEARDAGAPTLAAITDPEGNPVMLVQQ